MKFFKKYYKKIKKKKKKKAKKGQNVTIFGFTYTHIKNTCMFIKLIFAE